MRFLYKGDQIWRVPTASAFDVVGVDSATFERCYCLLHEPGLVE